MTAPIDPAISQDMVLGGQVTILQAHEGYRVAIDPIFLAAATPLDQGRGRPQRIMDLGAGNGVVGFCLLARDPQLHVVAVDRDAGALARAGQAARLNGVEDNWCQALADVGRRSDFAEFAKFDQVVVNPPFLPDQRSDPGKALSRQSSDLEGDTPLSAWIMIAADVLRHKGRLTMIHRADRVSEICAALRPVFGQITLCPLWPKAGVAAKRVLISARKGSRGADIFSPGVVLHLQSGDFTYSARQILNGAGFDLANPGLMA